MNRTSAQFEVGQSVTWTSSNTRKRGVISHIVPVGKVPPEVGVRMKEYGSPRDHISYIVRGNKLNVNGLAMKPAATYWPLTSLLKPAE